MSFLEDRLKSELQRTFLRYADMPRSGYVPVLAPVNNGGRELSYLMIDAAMKRKQRILFVDNYYSALTRDVLQEMASEHHFGFVSMTCQTHNIPSEERSLVYLPMQDLPKQSATPLDRATALSIIKEMDTIGTMTLIFHSALRCDYYINPEGCRVVFFKTPEQCDAKEAVYVCDNNHVRLRDGSVRRIPLVSNRYLRAIEDGVEQAERERGQKP